MSIYLYFSKNETCQFISLVSLERHGRITMVVQDHCTLAAIIDSDACAGDAQVDADSNRTPRPLPLLHLIFDLTSNLFVNAKDL